MSVNQENLGDSSDDLEKEELERRVLLTDKSMEKVAVTSM